MTLRVVNTGLLMVYSSEGVDPDASMYNLSAVSQDYTGLLIRANHSNPAASIFFCVLMEILLYYGNTLKIPGKDT
jgi:hypothetical protein